MVNPQEKVDYYRDMDIDDEDVDRELNKKEYSELLQTDGLGASTLKPFKDMRGKLIQDIPHSAEQHYLLNYFAGDQPQQQEQILEERDSDLDRASRSSLSQEHRVVESPTFPKED